MWSIDREYQRVVIDGVPHTLSEASFRILEAMYDAGGEIVRWQTLAKFVGATVPGWFDHQVVRQHIYRLRRLLGPDAIRNESGFGWGLRAEITRCPTCGAETGISPL